MRYLYVVMFILLFVQAMSLIAVCADKSHSELSIIELEKQAATSAEAQYDLGLRYRTGMGVEQNFQEAVKWFLRSSKKGNGCAQYQLGYCYFYGLGVTQNYDDAVKWYTASAKQGNDCAQYSLGNCYQNGYGVDQNYKEAVKWYNFAAEQGNSLAQYYLASSYFLGQGILPSNEKAYFWWFIASTNDKSDLYKSSIAYRDIAEGKLSKEQITVIQRDAQEWLEKHKSD